MDQRERYDDPQEALRTALDGRQAQIWTATPGIVVKRNGNNVTVQPAIQARLVDTAGKFQDTNLPQLVNVPLVQPGGGGYGITFPIGEGDEVLVVFASRCIDGWWQGGGVQPQLETRMHDLSDGFAIPAPMSNPKELGSISGASCQLRSAGGTAYFEVGSNGVLNITTSGTVNVSCSSANVTATSSVQITSPTVTINGNLLVTGEITAGSSGSDSVTLQKHNHPSNGTPPTPGT